MIFIIVKQLDKALKRDSILINIDETSEVDPMRSSMATSTWKQREIDNREKEYLRLARRLLAEKGYAGFSMDRLADATEYSKGTLYQHFDSKEDVIACIGLEMEAVRHSLLQRATAFVGWTRERMIAMGVAQEVLYRQNPDYAGLEELVESAALREKMSEARRLALDKAIEHSAASGLAIIRDAIAEGDLKLPYGLIPEQVLLGLVGINKGLRLLWQANWWERTWVPDIPLVHNHWLNAVCDGLQWKPFGSEWDYDATLTRIWNEVFPEMAEAKGP